MKTNRSMPAIKPTPLPTLLSMALFTALLGAALLTTCTAPAADPTGPVDPATPTSSEQAPSTYILQVKQEVDGRQGVAWEGDSFWVSGSATLSRYDRDWNLLAVNQDPFAQGFDKTVNHIGDIDVYQGEIYCGVENFVDGIASNIQIAVYDGETLQLERAFSFDPESGQDECSGICVNPDEEMVVMCSWTSTGQYLYKYDLETGAYLGKVHLDPVPALIQGIAYYEGAYYLSSDDGDADEEEPDHLYRCVFFRDSQKTETTLELTLKDVEKQGEVEGLTFDEDSGCLLVLYNRGARIVEGMPVGFYEGYDHEIHEVYAYTHNRLYGKA